MEDFAWEERYTHGMFFVFISLHFANENKFSYFAGLLSMLPGSDRQQGEMTRLKDRKEVPFTEYREGEGKKEVRRARGYCVLGREGLVRTQWARVRTNDPEGKTSVLRHTT